ncbi:MAG: hypothetical protein JWQ76_5135 [Ramlibacter sp.]|nr:hypothetical protein [Ramlibacter sp.]
MAQSITDTARGTRPPATLAIALACLLAFVLALAAHLTGQAEDLRPSDDNLWMYYAGTNLAHWDRGERLNAQLVSELKAAGASDYIVRRAILRTGYAGNMAFTAGTLYTTGRLSHWLRGDGDGAGYDRTIGDAVQFGYLAVFCLAAALALAIVASLRRLDIALAALLAIATAIGLSALSDPGFFILFRVRELGPHIANTWAFLLNPGPQFSVFGFTPRNTVYVLSLAVLALRARGWYGLAYAAVLPLAFVHQSVGALMFALLAGLDAVLRPQVFRRPAVFVPAGAFVLLLAFRENLWEVIGLSGGVAALALAGLLALAVLGWLLRRRVLAAHAAIRRRVERVGEMEADGLLLAAGFVLTYPIVYLIVPHVDQFTMVHFWGQLHARIWAQIQPWFLFIAWWAVLRRPDLVRLQRAVPALALLALCLALPKAWTSRHLDYSLAAFRKGLVQLETDRVHPFATVQEAEEREDRFFYEMARTIDTGEESLRPLFQRLVPAAAGAR